MHFNCLGHHCLQSWPYPSKTLPIASAMAPRQFVAEMGPAQPERTSTVKCPWQSKPLPGLTGKKKQKAKEMSQRKRISIPCPLHLHFSFFFLYQCLPLLHILASSFCPNSSSAITNSWRCASHGLIYFQPPGFFSLTFPEFSQSDIWLSSTPMPFPSTPNTFRHCLKNPSHHQSLPYACTWSRIPLLWPQQLCYSPQGFKSFSHRKQWDKVCQGTK